jgi:hypothetical protein
VRRKDFKGDDAQVERCFVIKMSNLVELFLGVRFAFLKRRRRNDFLDRRLDVVVIDGCDFGVVCYCC